MLFSFFIYFCDTNTTIIKMTKKEIKKLKKELSKTSDKELDEILDGDYNFHHTNALEILPEEIQKREYRTDKVIEIEKEIATRRRIYSKVQKHTFQGRIAYGWNPKSNQSIETKLPQDLALHTIQYAFMILYWDVVYADDNTVEAKRIGGQKNEPREKIIVEFKNNTVQIISKSLESNVCDFGSNHKRIEEFKTAFLALEEEYDAEKIESKSKELEKEKEDIKAAYQIPETLSSPPIIQESNLGILLLGAGFTSVILGITIGLITSVFMYLLFLYDAGIAFATSFTLVFLIKWSHISDYKQLQWIGYGTILLSYFVNQITQYFYLTYKFRVSDVSFWEYIVMSYNNGIYYEELRISGWGMLIVWVIEIGIAILLFRSFFANRIINYDYKQVPEDVLEFAIYYFEQEEKTEEEVRKELEKKGWTEEKQQDLVFKAIGAIITYQNSRR